jgi:hypothetical protein
MSIFASQTKFATKTRLKHLIAAAILCMGALSVSSPAEARMGGFGGGHGGFGGFRGGAMMRPGFGRFHAPMVFGRRAFVRPMFAHPGFVNRPFFANRPVFVNRRFFANRPAFVNRRFFANRRFFFPHRRFASVAVGGYYFGDYDSDECYVVVDRTINPWGYEVITRRLVCS